MEPGKLASQAVHAARLSLLRYIKDNPARLDEFISLGCCGTMVVLYAKNLGQLVRAHERAVSAGLPAALFIDSGHIPSVEVSAGEVDGLLTVAKIADSEHLQATNSPGHPHRRSNKHFDGGPIPTAMAIGPALRQDMTDITEKFRCVP